MKLENISEEYNEEDSNQFKANRIQYSEESDELAQRNTSRRRSFRMNSVKSSLNYKLLQHLEEQNQEEESNKTFRQKIDLFMNAGKKQVIEFISAFFSFTTFVIYIISTYGTEQDFIWFNYLDYVICFYFNLENLMNIYLAQHPLLFILKEETLLNIFTSTISYLSLINNIFIKKLVEISRIFRIIKIMRYLNKNMKSNENEVAKHIIMMVLSALTLILIFTLLFRLAEIDQINYYIMNPDIRLTSYITQSQFHDFLYYIVVTVATVGYGDIYPITEQGRVVIIILIILTIYLIPKQTNELIKLMTNSSVYSRATYKANPEIPHVVICGNVGVDALKNFCHELFHNDHGQTDKNAVIIQNYMPNQDMRVFLHAGVYEVSLKYLQGNPILEKDLHRADVINAKAAVIMTDKYTDDPHSTDHKNILLSLAIKKYYIYQDIYDSQLFIQLIKPENKIHYQSGLQSLSPNTKFNSDQVIIVEEIKMNLLSKSCLIPGIITMVSNLVRSSGNQNEDLDSQWLEEYTEGAGHEIYRTILNDCFKNKTFSQISREIYQQYEAIVFALEIEVEGKTIISLNPGNFFIEKLVNERKDVSFYIYIICSDKDVADKIETADLLVTKEDQITNDKPRADSKYEEYMRLKIEDTQQIEENVDPSNELVEEEDDYFIIKDRVNNNIDVKIDSIRNSDVYTKHVVVCGIHQSLYYFILPLRAKYLGRENLKHIVILTQDMPKDLWDSISRFENIVLINGSPLNTEDLYRANIEYADKAVILECETTKYSTYDNQMVDSEAVFIYKAIKKCNQNIQIMTELVYDSNIEFLLPKEELRNLRKDGRISYESTSLFSAGEVYISSIIDTLTCQAYYNKHIVTIIHQLLTGGKHKSNVTMRGICENVGLKSSNLWQIPVPEKFINKTFMDMYIELSSENLIALGLYRLRGAKDNDNPYVYTNPKPSTRLTHKDRVFVLAIDKLNAYSTETKIEDIPVKNTNKDDPKFDNVRDSIFNEEYNKNSKITPFRELEDVITEVEKQVRNMENVLEIIRNSLHENIATAVKQEISSLLH